VTHLALLPRFRRLVIAPLLLAALTAGCVPLTPYAEVRSALPEASLLRIDGHLVHVVDRGPRSGAEAVVFVHGFGASAHSWRRVMELLPEYRTIALDLNGFGYTERPDGIEPYTRRGQVELIRSVMDRLGLDRVHLVGHSYGGALALAFAELYPERVLSLTAVDSAHPDYPENRRRAIAAASPLTTLYIRAYALRKGSVRRALEDSVWDDSIVTPEMVDAYVERLRVEGAPRAYHGVTAPAPKPRETIRLEEIPVPVLVVWGAEDALIPIETGRRATDLIPCHRFVTLPKTGHMPMEERPEELVQAMREFLVDPETVCR